MITENIRNQPPRKTLKTFKHDLKNETNKKKLSVLTASDKTDCLL